MATHTKGVETNRTPGWARNANPDVDAELAALLDYNTRPSGSTRASGEAPAGPAGPALQGELIDIPISRSESSEIPSGAVLFPYGNYERILPVTKRFGAIIMETGSQILGQSGRSSATLPPGPGIETEPASALPVPIPRTDDQKTLIVARLNSVLNPQWEAGLHEQINELYKEVTTEYSSPPDAAQKMLALLREARQVMIEAPEDFVNAEYRLMQVRAMLDRIKESRRQSRAYAPGIFIYQFGWLLVLLGGLIFAGPIADTVARIGKVVEPQLINLAPILNTMIWGGIGGVVGALYALWWHVSDKQDFDRHYQMWYFVQPLMGMVLGAITFLIMTGGLLILDVNIAGDSASPGARLLPYLVAVLAGFKQNFVYDQLERLVGAFTPASRKANGAETSG